jgi:hypothetical protein
VEQGGINADEFGVLSKALHRLERFFSEQILYQNVVSSNNQPRPPQK